MSSGCFHDCYKGASPPMTAKLIQRELIRTRWTRNFILPNYTPKGWWECDLFELTAAGLFREYEIKVSLSDFRKDATKERNTWQTRTNPLSDPINKHVQIRARHPASPTRFFYVTPTDLLSPEIVPYWAGLITVHRSGSRLVETVKKPAPLLHKGKVSEDVRDHARGICYWRMHRALLRSGHGEESDTKETAYTPPSEERSCGDKRDAQSVSPAL